MKKTALLFLGLGSLIFTNQAQTVSDKDGNVYNPVTIGTQVWLIENLKVTHYRNGDPIDNVTDQTQWDALTAGAYSNYNNDVSNAVTYGRLYNWYAVSDIRNIAPEGWHVPTVSDWTTLLDYLGGTSVACNKLRETGNVHWDALNGGDGNKYATNSSGFTALPGGFRIVGETFEYMSDFGFWWSNSESSADNADYLYMTITSVSLESYKKAIGGSVRCIKDSPITKINDINNTNKIKIYPNPATDKVYIALTEEQVCKMQICNMTGVCVLQLDLKNSVNLIDINSLPKGIYFINLINKNVTIRKKMIKQ
jgi:uncharacterized protein (TIGR02145 family)